MSYQELKFSCRNGDLTIRGTEYRPEGENLPVAIMCHGFMANQDSVRLYTKTLAELGYDAFCFDFPGGCAVGESDGDNTKMSVMTEVEDLLAVIDYVRGLPQVGKELLIGGCSQGGIVSALVAARIPEVVTKLVLFYPAFCIPDDARNGFNSYATFDPANIPDILPCGPWIIGGCFPRDVLDLDPYEVIPAYQGPVLVVRGEIDDCVPVSYGVRAKEVYGDAATLFIIPGAGHGFHGEHDELAVQYLKDFAKLD